MEEKLKNTTSLENDSTYFVSNPEISCRTDHYFNNTQGVVNKFGDVEVVYSFFLRSPSIAATKLVVEFLKKNYPANHKIPLKIDLQYEDGELVPSGKVIMYVTGSMAVLSPLETLALQRLGFACVSAYNAYEMASAMPKSAFLDMHARHATGDDMTNACAYGASVGSKTARIFGAKGFIGTSQGLVAHYFGDKEGKGTNPHSLVGYAKAKAMMEGKTDFNSTLESVKMFHETFPNAPKIVALVDYDGKEVTDSIAVANWFYNEAKLHEKGKVLGIRLDTHGGRWCEGLDWGKSVETLMKWTHLETPNDVLDMAVKNFKATDLAKVDIDTISDKYLFGTGVTAANLIWVRKKLEEAGFRDVEITASSGFNPTKTKVMSNLNIPIDVIGTGSFIPEKISGAAATADIVRYTDVATGKHYDIVKEGREYLKLTA